jgi:hypothetical protein
MTEVAEGTLKEPGTGQAPRRSTRRLRPWRQGCLAGLQSVLVCLCSTWTGQWLGLRGDVVLSAGQPGEIRLWLARDPQGSALAVSVRRLTPSNLGDACPQTSVRSLPLSLGPMSEGVTYCRCAAHVGIPLAPSGACPQ